MQSRSTTRTGFPRQLEDEVLDHLQEDDPRAIQSRKDLQKINRIMASAGIIARAMMHSPVMPKHIVELGAGDGHLMLRIAKRMAPAWPKVQLTLLDRQDLVTPQARASFERLGWTAQVMRADVMDWVSNSSAERADIVVANLFVHHFDDGQIKMLFAAVARRACMFIACEPRRGKLPLLASRMVGLLGANEVTRTDAVLSVRAGFCDQELSTLWPQDAPGWRIKEKPAGLFSHLFIATREMSCT